MITNFKIFEGNYSESDDSWKKFMNRRESDTPDEVTKIEKILIKLIKNNLSSEYPDYMTLDKRLEKGHPTYSLIYDTYNNYFLFQFDYKDDGLWIKFMNSCSDSLKSDINIFISLFNNVSVECDEYVWKFDDTLSRELDNFDTYMKSKKFNL